MTKVTVPKGTYIVTAGAYAYSSAPANEITCEIHTSNGGFPYQTYSSLTISGADLTLRCGVLNEVASGEIQIMKMFVRAERVESSKISERIPTT